MKKVCAETKTVTFLEFAESVCQAMPWLAPVYYLRLVLTALKDVCILPQMDFHVSLEIAALEEGLEDKEQEKTWRKTRQTEIERILEDKKRAQEVWQKLLKTSGPTPQEAKIAAGRVQELRDSGRYAMVRAVSDLDAVQEGVKRLSEGLSPLELYDNVSISLCKSRSLRELDYLEDYWRHSQACVAGAKGKAKQSREDLAFKAGRLVQEWRDLRPPLWEFRSPEEDLIRLCLWKGYPVPESHRNKVTADDSVRNHSLDADLKAEHWDLPAAIRKLCGRIENTWEVEVEFRQCLGMSTLSNHAEDIHRYRRYVKERKDQDKEFVEYEDLCIMQTLEYSRAATAIKAKEIDGFTGTHAGHYYVTPKSFITWAVKQGLPVPHTLAPAAPETVNKIGLHNKLKAAEMRKRIISAVNRQLGPDRIGSAEEVDECFFKNENGRRVVNFSGIAGYLLDHEKCLFGADDVIRPRTSGRLSSIISKAHKANEISLPKTD